ncbi:MAG: peptide-methionine (S)-S-oxide reductase MsrA [Chloroflexi bacterium]|nr:peptide-methionine (S)-S-oxide reductase MsrA [Chloroflexota bacterium]
MSEKAVFGAGCFWGVEHAFNKLDGVSEAVSGFMGGDVADPSYQLVCTGETGHVEVVEVTYDPEVVSYADLLDTFWAVHDPTQLNRQGPDIGEQYRSVIFVNNEEQGKQAEEAMQALMEAGRYPKQVVTEIEPEGEFYRAEEYHQRYYAKMGRQ